MQFFFSPTGRIGRIQWWLGGLPPLAILVTTIIYFAVSVDEGGEAVFASNVSMTAFIGFTLFGICFWINFCLTAKRYHDRDKSAFWTLVNIIPVIGPIWQLVECGFLPGSPGGNSYGADGGLNWSGIEAEIAAMQHDNSETCPPAQSPVMRKTPRRQASTARSNRVSAGFGQRGLQP